MNEQKISVIIPIYNGGRFLADTIQGILNQTFESFDLILVDDGSTDNTLGICDYYRKCDSRIRVVHKENGGMSSARDYGYQHAEKDSWILFFDADDIPSPNMLEKLWQHHASDLVLSSYDDIASNVIMQTPFDLSDNRIVSGNGTDMMNYILEGKATQGRTGSMCGVLIHPRFMEKHYQSLHNVSCLFPQNYMNDAYATVRLVKAANSVLLYDNNVFHHRVSNYTDSRSLIPNALAYELLAVQYNNLKYYKENASVEAYHSMLLGFYLVILKLWYQVKKYEPNQKKAKRWTKKIQKAFALYWDDFRKIRYETFYDRMAKITVVLFKISPKLWTIFVGNVKYGLSYNRR